MRLRAICGFGKGPGFGFAEKRAVRFVERLSRMASGHCLDHPYVQAEHAVVGWADFKPRCTLHSAHSPSAIRRDAAYP